MSEFNDAVNGNVNDDDDDQQLVAIVDNDSNGVELISINNVNTAVAPSSTASIDENRIRVLIKEEDLLCTNGCGFFGTPQWKGLCSRCWRLHQLEDKRKQDYAKNRSLLSFDRFEEKRKQVFDRRSSTIKSLLGRSPSTPVSIFDPSSITLPQSPSSTQLAIVATPPTTPSLSSTNRVRKLSVDSSEARDRFKDYLHTLPRSVATDIAKHTNHAVDKIFSNHSIPIDDLSELVQNFYHVMEDRLHKNHSMTDKNAIKEVMEQIEQYFCIRTYHVLFSSTTEEEVADLSLQERIRSLNWVTAGFLETSLDSCNAKVTDLVFAAVAAMIEINGPRAVSEKLDRLVRCCKLIFEALIESRISRASADEFLPVLISVILKGNPPLILSNINFISRFALQSRLEIGEPAYFFTTLSCALQFIQDMNADSLKMQKELFDDFTSGRQAVPLNSYNSPCEQIYESMQNSLKQIDQLVQHQQRISDRIDQFNAQVIRETDQLFLETRECVNKYAIDRVALVETIDCNESSLVCKQSIDDNADKIES